MNIQSPSGTKTVDTTIGREVVPPGKDAGTMKDRIDEAIKRIEEKTDSNVQIPYLVQEEPKKGVLDTAKETVAGASQFVSDKTMPAKAMPVSTSPLIKPHVVKEGVVQNEPTLADRLGVAADLTREKTVPPKKGILESAKESLVGAKDYVAERAMPAVTATPVSEEPVCKPSLVKEHPEGVHEPGALDTTKAKAAEAADVTKAKVSGAADVTKSKVGAVSAKTKGKFREAAAALSAKAKAVKGTTSSTASSTSSYVSGKLKTSAGVTKAKVGPALASGKGTLANLQHKAALTATSGYHSGMNLLGRKFWELSEWLKDYGALFAVKASDKLSDMWARSRGHVGEARPQGVQQTQGPATTVPFDQDIATRAKAIQDRSRESVRTVVVETPGMTAEEQQRLVEAAARGAVEGAKPKYYEGVSQT